MAWDNPPEFTTMHRPGIASVEGDCIVLNGTTLEEVEAYHAKTLQLVIERANQEIDRREALEKQEQERSEQEAKAHEEKVAEVAKRIKFE